MFAAVQTTVYIFQRQQNENDKMEEGSLSDDDSEIDDDPEIFDDLEQLEGRAGSRLGRQNCPRDFEAAHQQLLNDSSLQGVSIWKEIRDAEDDFQ